MSIHFVEELEEIEENDTRIFRSVKFSTNDFYLI